MSDQELENTIQSAGGLRLETGGSLTVAPNWAAIASLSKKMAGVMGELKTVLEDSKHPQGWKYASYSAVATALREALSSQSLGLFANLIQYKQEIQGKGLKSLVEVEFTFADGETGAMRTSRWAGEAVDFGSADKGLNKAYTAAEKYFLMRTFLVSTSDDVESDASSEPEDQAGSQTTRNPQAESGPYPVQPKQAQGPPLAKPEKPDQPKQRSSAEERMAIALARMFYARWDPLFPEDKDHEIAHREFRVASIKDLYGKVTPQQMAPLLDTLDLAMQNTLTVQQLKELLGLVYLIDWFAAGYTREGGVEAIARYIEQQAGTPPLESVGQQPLEMPSEAEEAADASTTD